MNAPTVTSRLRELVHVGAGRSAVGQPEHAGGMSAMLARLRETVGGELREWAGGSCLVVDRRYETAMTHGRITVGRCADAVRRCAAHLPVLDVSGRQCLSTIAREPSAIFFDLETTGLAGGAGTYAFLVGCGAFVSGAFHTRQYFLIGYGIERPLLAAVAEDLASADVLVSFNGRTFDAPLLESRYLFHRVAAPFVDQPHVDMLHVARRLWSGDAGCSLRVLEATLAGLSREGDIPGSEIPARYVHYVRSGDARPLVPVFEHNRLDLLSLAVLMATAVELVERGAEGTRNARECLGLGRLYERAAMRDRATRCYAHASSGDVPGSREDQAEALRCLARRLRRDRRHDDAADAWQEILAVERGTNRVTQEAAHALAVHYEHRSRDLRAAHRYAVRSATAATTEADRLQARHRLARLERKLGLEQGPGDRALFG